MSVKPLKVVMIRRGKNKVTNVPSENLVTFIRKKALLGTDELSGDGKNWIRVDRHYQLRKYFLDSGEVKLEVSEKLKNGDQVGVGSMNPPPGLMNELEEAAGLLKDINE
jgi:hypothetical protein